MLERPGRETQAEPLTGHCQRQTRQPWPWPRVLGARFPGEAPWARGETERTCLLEAYAERAKKAGDVWADRMCDVGGVVGMVSNVVVVAGPEEPKWRTVEPLICYILTSCSTTPSHAGIFLFTRPSLLSYNDCPNAARLALPMPTDSALKMNKKVNQTLTTLIPPVAMHSITCNTHHFTPNPGGGGCVVDVGGLGAGLDAFVLSSRPKSPGRARGQP